MLGLLLWPSSSVISYHVFHTDSNYDKKIVKYVKGIGEAFKILAPVYVIEGHVPQVDPPTLYKVVDAFVLPSRSEGWDRPVVEAMAMEFPVITTNRSGPH